MSLTGDNITICVAKKERLLQAFMSWGRVLLVLVLLCVALGGCRRSLPHSGPTEHQFMQQQTSPRKNSIGYGIIPLNVNLIAILASEKPSLLSRFSEEAVHNDSEDRNDTVHPGDVIQVSIYEMGNAVFSGGVNNSMSNNSIAQALTSGGSTGGGASPSNSSNLIMGHSNNDLRGAPGATLSNLPPVIVSRYGTVTLPYIGEIAVEGETTDAIAAHIRGILTNKSQTPQVMVRFVQNISNSVIVYGDVNRQGRILLTPNNERLLDVVALAQGMKHPSADTIVQLMRGDEVVRVPMSVPVKFPSQNIRVEAGDRVQLLYKPRTYMTFGGAGKVNEIPFKVPVVSLAQAIARSGGPSDNKSNPKGVFLLRYENNDVVRRLSLPVQPTGFVTPIVYKLDLMNPAQYFLAQHFELKDKDMIYFSNANTVELSKLLQMINTITQPAESAGYMMR